MREKEVRWTLLGPWWTVDGWRLSLFKQWGLNVDRACVRTGPGLSGPAAKLELLAVLLSDPLPLAVEFREHWWNGGRVGRVARLELALDAVRKRWAE